MCLFEVSISESSYCYLRPWSSFLAFCTWLAAVIQRILSSFAFCLQRDEKLLNGREMSQWNATLTVVSGGFLQCVTMFLQTQRQDNVS